jgi:hypothetical protein
MAAVTALDKIAGGGMLCYNNIVIFLIGFKIFIIYTGDKNEKPKIIYH